MTHPNIDIIVMTALPIMFTGFATAVALPLRKIIFELFTVNGDFSFS